MKLYLPIHTTTNYFVQLFVFHLWRSVFALDLLRLAHEVILVGHAIEIVPLECVVETDAVLVTAEVVRLVGLPVGEG